MFLLFPSSPHPSKPSKGGNPFPMVPWQQCVVCPSTFLMNRRHALRISLLLYLIKKLEKVQGERLKRYFKWVAIGMGNGQMKKCLWTRSKVGYQGHFRYTLRVVIAIKPMPWAKRGSLYNHNRYSYCIWIFGPILVQLGPTLAQSWPNLGPFCQIMAQIMYIWPILSLV